MNLLFDGLGHNVTARSQSVRQRAIDSVQANPAAVLEWAIESLRRNWDEDWRALFVFQYLETNLISALPVVIPFLRSRDSVIRKTAVQAIIRIGPEATAAVPALMPLLEDEEYFVQCLAVLALFTIGIGPSEGAAVEPIGWFLAREIDPPRRWKQVENIVRAATLLRLIGPVAVPTLVKCFRAVLRVLEHDGYCDWFDYKPICQALVELASCSDCAPLVVPALVEFGEGAFCNEVLSGQVNYALRAIGPPAVPVLIEILKSERFARAAVVAYALGEIGPLAKDAVPALIRLLQDQYSGRQARIAAAWALGTMGSQAKVAVPLLTAALQDEDRFVRDAVKHALWLIVENPT